MRFLLLNILSLFLLLNIAVADNATNLEKIVKQIESQESELLTLNQRKLDLKKKLESAEIRINEISKRKKDLSIELEELQVKIALLDAQINDLIRNQEQVKRGAKSRYVKMYKKWRYGSAHVSTLHLFDKNSFDYPTLVKYENRIQQSEKNMLSRYIESELALAEKRDEAQFLINDQDALKIKLQNEEKGLVKERKARKVIIKNIGVEEEAVRVLLTSLRAKALRFEIAFSTLIEEQKKYKVKRRSFLTSAARNAGSNDNQILNGLKKNLATFPIDGSWYVLHDFGRRKIQNFKDIVHNKGVEVRNDKPSVVRALSQGKVIFSGKMPGYGKVIIVNHGKRDYSLYGKLADVKVNVGESLTERQVIGAIVHDSNGEIPFYIEVRKGGKSVNPKPYFRDWNAVAKP